MVVTTGFKKANLLSILITYYFKALNNKRLNVPVNIIEPFNTKVEDIADGFLVQDSFEGFNAISLTLFESGEIYQAVLTQTGDYSIIKGSPLKFYYLADRYSTILD